MKQTAPLGGGAAASANEERSRPFNNLPHRSPQYPAKYRAAASHLRRTQRKFEPAPPDPGIVPGGVRDRAMRAMLRRGLR